ncbi:hypothetical protein [Allosphingosinicella deserti]|uniref:hypothetical protein n=1 Tax=Allosphingosinicella deserti TaxID=2116704 RepID=UPI0018EC773D|nr:hypothetical protein [Sphingomonas deserti]
MRTMTLVFAGVVLAAGADPAAAQDGKVATSGKSDVALGDVPAPVLDAAKAARPGFTPVEAEAETREGRRYFDVEGTLPDGSEIEFDIMEEGGRWRVVETQRDIPLAIAPEPVRRAAAAHDSAFTPNRVIESSQADGLVIYELFGTKGGDPQGRKIEIKWNGKRAEVLKQEWAH